MGDIPTVLGEFGIPFDMHEKQAYRTNDFKFQLKAMDRCYRAVEANLMDSALWNYTADNSNARGDLWNDEDFSIYSPDQRKNPENLYSGGRALAAVVRPYPRFTSGTPLKLSFDLDDELCLNTGIPVVPNPVIPSSSFQLPIIQTGSR